MINRCWYFLNILDATRGFSLLELLLVMSIFSILLSIGLANYASFWHTNKTTSIVDQLITALNEARHEAIIQNSVTTYCGSENQIQCDGQWSKGQIILVDHQTLPLRVYAGLSANDQLYWRSNLGMNDFLRFAPTGFTLGQNGSFYYCPNNHSAKQTGAIVVVALTGRIRVDNNRQDVEQGCAVNNSAKVAH